MDIQPYLQEVYEQFKKQIEESPEDILRLKDCSFEGKGKIDYTDELIQELYILRYSFAYSFEYYVMYSKILDLFEGADHLNVLSLGCGPMTDYWSFCRAFSEKSQWIPRENVSYAGVDLIDWKHKMPGDDKIKWEYVQSDFLQYAKSADLSDTDIFFFPKSICEVDLFQDMPKLCDSLKRNLKKERIIFGITLRNEYDEDRVKSICDALKSNGYQSTIIENADYKNGEDEKTKKPKYQAIYTASNREFKYPNDVKDNLLNLSKKAAIDDKDKAEELHDALDRSPILTASKINYRIVVFERKKT